MNNALVECDNCGREFYFEQVIEEYGFILCRKCVADMDFINEDAKDQNEL